MKKCPKCGAELKEAIFEQMVCTGNHTHIFNKRWIDGYWTGYNDMSILLGFQDENNENNENKEDWNCETCGSANAHFCDCCTICNDIKPTIWK